MPSASASRSVMKSLMMGPIGASMIFLSTPPQEIKSKAQFECERGILDAGEDGMNVLVFELCAGRLTVGFKNSDAIEEITCTTNGDIQLWLLTDDDKCARQPAGNHDQVYELWEPLKGVGRATAAPVRQLLKCSGGTMKRARIFVPDARTAILETRTGDTEYEKITRHFLSQCIPPIA